MKSKNGITLLMLVVTIILVLTFSATITVSTFNALANARITAFAQDLKKVEDETTLYYEQNDTFPVLGEDKAYSKAEILEIVDLENKEKFNEELTLNKDNVENDNLGTFYKIDIAKLGVTQTTRGIQKDENGAELKSDIFVVAYPSMNIYYLNGLSEKNTVYFSLSSKINKIVKITPNMEVRNENKTIISTADVTVKRAKKTWTNKLNLLIEANMLHGEKLFVSLEDGLRHQIKTKRGFNTFYFEDSLSTILANSNSELIVTGITKDEIQRFESKDQSQKKLKITKEKDGYVLGEIIVDLANYDTDLPFRTTDTTITSDEYNNIITFKVADNTSSVKEVKYEYLRKFDELANANLYFNNTEEYDIGYVKIKGKEAQLLEDGTAVIKVPKDIEGIQVRVFDKAGNASDLINLNTTIPVYIGINEKNPTKKGVTLNNVIKTSESIDSAKISLSTNGKDFTDEQNLNLSDEENYVYKSVVECEDLVDVNDKIYVKIVVNYAGNKKEVRIKEIKVYKEISAVKDGELVTGSPKKFTDSNGDTATIPIGFAIVPGKNLIQDGLVISDKPNDVSDEGNQFVWIPVNDMSTFVRECGYYNGELQTNLLFTDFSEPLNYKEVVASQYEIDEYNKMKASVEAYHGFYIGRYEISNDGSDNAQSKKNKAPWVSIKCGNSMTDLTGGIVEKVRNMYPEEEALKGGVVSTLVYGVAWDEMVRFIMKNHPNIEKDSDGYGNYTNTVQDTGSNGDYSLNNIYDISGNVWEWTMESYQSSDYTVRGGGISNSSSGAKYPVSNRSNNNPTYYAGSLGGRCQLYIKCLD